MVPSRVGTGGLMLAAGNFIGEEALVTIEGVNAAGKVVVLETAKRIEAQGQEPTRKAILEAYR